VIVVAAIVLWRAGSAVARSRDASVNALIERRASLAVSMAVLVAGLYWLGVRLLGA